MANSKKIEYKIGIEDLLKCSTHRMKIEIDGLKLASKLMNGVNDSLVQNTETEYKNAGKITKNTLRYCGKKALEQAFNGNLKQHAIAEACRQLALLHSGVMTYGDGSTPTIQPRMISEEETPEDKKLKRNEHFIRQFKASAGKFCSTNIDDFSVDSAGKSLLGLRLHGFMKIIAEKSAEMYPKKEELQPIDIKNIIAKYLAKEALEAANGEGIKNLLLFENGLLDFKPRVHVKTDWSKDKVKREEIFTKVFKPTLEKVLAEKVPDAVSDRQVSKYLGNDLMDIAKYLAQNTADTCQKKKKFEVDSEDIFQVVAAVFPRQLKLHAILKGSNDVKDFRNGNLIYEREPDKPKTKPKIKKVDKPFKTKPQPETKRSKKRTTSKSRTPSKSRTTSKLRTSKKPRKPTPKRPKTPKQAPLKLKFAPAIIDIIPQAFENAEIILCKGTSNNLCQILNEAFDELASSGEANESGDFGVEEMKAAIVKVLPTSLADLGLARGQDISFLLKTEETS